MRRTPGLDSSVGRLPTHPVSNPCPVPSSPLLRFNPSRSHPSLPVLRVLLPYSGPTLSTPPTGTRQDLHGHFHKDLRSSPHPLTGTHVSSSPPPSQGPTFPAHRPVSAHNRWTRSGILTLRHSDIHTVSCAYSGIHTPHVGALGLPVSYIRPSPHTPLSVCPSVASLVQSRESGRPS